MNDLEPETGFVDVPGARLYYEVTGAGHPLALIHAGVANLRMWDEQAPAFARRHRTIAYDARAYGESLSEPISFSNRQDLADLLAHLGVERTYLLGISRGGQIALDFTLEHPEWVDALILVAAGISGYEHQPGPDEQIAVSMFEEMERAWEQRDIERLVDLEVRMWADGPGQPEGRAPATVRERLRAMDLDSFTRHPAADAEPQPIPLEPPALGRLSEVRVPTLVICGDLDTVATRRMAELLVAGIPGARQVVFRGVAHMVNMERPDDFNRVVLDFLGSL